MADDKKKTVKDNFSDALQYFGPKVVAYMVGSAIGGGEGGLKGMAVQEDLSSGFSKFKKDREPASEEMSEYQKGSLDLRKKELKLAKNRFSMTQGRMERIQKQFLTSVARDFDRDKMILGSRQGVSSVLSTLKHLENGNQITDNAIKRILARTIGQEAGVMTDKDVADFEGDRRFKEQLKQWKATYINTGKLTPHNRNLFRQALNTALQVEQNLLKGNKARFVHERSDEGTDFRTLMERRFIQAPEIGSSTILNRNELPDVNTKKEVGSPDPLKNNLKKAITNGQVQPWMMQAIEADEELKQLLQQQQQK